MKQYAVLSVVLVVAAGAALLAWGPTGDPRAQGPEDSTQRDARESMASLGGPVAEEDSSGNFTISNAMKRDESDAVQQLEQEAASQSVSDELDDSLAGVVEPTSSARREGETQAQIDEAVQAHVAERAAVDAELTKRLADAPANVEPPVDAESLRDEATKRTTELQELGAEIEQQLKQQND